MTEESETVCTGSNREDTGCVVCTNAHRCIVEDRNGKRRVKGAKGERGANIEKILS